MASSAAKNIIIDTDLYSDVDDAAALLLGSTLPGANLLGVNVNFPSSHSISAVSAILAHYGRSHVPISAPRPLNGKSFFDDWHFELGEFCSKVAYHWSGGSIPFGEAEKALDPVEMYRSALANAEDNSVTIASIGFLDSLSALLNSTADSHSKLDGRELVRQKVTELVVMGGSYPEGRRSWNFWGSDPSLAAHVINTWEGPITFVGVDVGKHVLSGGPLMLDGPESDPVRMAMIYYSYFRPISSWDPLTLLYAVGGLGDLFERGNDYGYNHINPDGSNTWFDDASRKGQHYLRLKVSTEHAASVLDEKYLDAARRFTNKKPLRPPPSLMIKKENPPQPLTQKLMIWGSLLVILCLLSWPVYCRLTEDVFGSQGAQGYTPIQRNTDEAD